jgi:hypothetical protein
MTTMKKLITLLSIVITTSVMAQNLTTFGLSGNPDNIVQNPGADPMTSFQLRYAGFQANAGLNATAGQLLGTNDLLGNMLSTGLSSTDFMFETNVVLPHLGIKLGDNYLFAGTELDVTVGAVIDNDLVRFVKSGMVDAFGTFDPNYTSDFSDFGVNLQVNQNTYFGYQRTLMDNKLRVGATYTMHDYLTSFNVNATNFNISTSGNTGSPNSFAVNYDIDIAGGIDFNNIDSLQNVSSAVTLDTLQNSVLENIGLGSMTSSIGFGLTYKPVKRVELAFSMNGLGAETLNFASRTSKTWSGSSTIDGFEYTSQAGDSLSVKVGEAVSQYTEDLSASIGTTLSNGNYQQTLQIAQNTNAAANFYLNKYSYIGAHYTARSNSFRDFEYFGLNTMIWLGRNLQIKGGYYLALDETNADIINAAIQFRITPILHIYAGSNTVGDISTVANSLIQDGSNPQIGAATTGVNLSAGVSFTALDGRFESNKKAERKNKADRKAKEAKSLSPAQKKKVDDAAANSSTKK